MILYQDPVSKKCYAKDPETDELYELVPLVRLPSLELATRLAEKHEELMQREDARADAALRRTKRTKKEPEDEEEYDHDFEKIGDDSAKKEKRESFKPAIIKLILEGKKNVDIAREVGCGYQNVYAVRQEMIKSGALGPKPEDDTPSGDEPFEDEESHA